MGSTIILDIIIVTIVTAEIIYFNNNGNFGLGYCNTCSCNDNLCYSQCSKCYNNINNGNYCNYCHCGDALCSSQCGKCFNNNNNFGNNNFGNLFGGGFARGNNQNGGNTGA